MRKTKKEVSNYLVFSSLSPPMTFPKTKQKLKSPPPLTYHPRQFIQCLNPASVTGRGKDGEPLLKRENAGLSFCCYTFMRFLYFPILPLLLSYFILYPQFSHF